MLKVAFSSNWFFPGSGRVVDPAFVLRPGPKFTVIKAMHKTRELSQTSENQRGLDLY